MSLGCKERRVASLGQLCSPQGGGTHPPPWERWRHAFTGHLARVCRERSGDPASRPKSSPFLQPPTLPAPEAPASSQAGFCLPSYSAPGVDLSMDPLTPRPHPRHTAHPHPRWGLLRASLSFLPHLLAAPPARDHPQLPSPTQALGASLCSAASPRPRPCSREECAGWSAAAAGCLVTPLRGDAPRSRGCTTTVTSKCK